MRLFPALGLIAVLALSGCVSDGPTTGAAAPQRAAFAELPRSGSAAVGGSLAQRSCAGCHAIGRDGDSPMKSAPPFRTLGGEYHGRDREGLVAAALFWYITIAVYAVLWYAIYVTK